MNLALRKITLQKKRPLTISRGTSSAAQNLFVTVSHDGVHGIGEMAPIGYGHPQTAEEAEESLSALAAELSPLSPFQIQEVEGVSARLRSGARCALINACYDWTGTRLGVPVHTLLGLSPVQAKTSITAGIMAPEALREIVPQLLSETNTDSLKLKLGSPEGIENDKEAFIAAKESAPPGTHFRVDANGGWILSDAKKMCDFLAERSCDYIEQPLGFGDEEALADLHHFANIPIFLDEYIETSRDVARFAGMCDGVNLKLMKAGGISEGLRVVHTAKAHGLMTMIGCFGESAVSISAAAAIGSLFDYIDLDSHLNLVEQPYSGCAIEAGALVPCDTPGLGLRSA